MKPYYRKLYQTDELCSFSINNILEPRIEMFGRVAGFTWSQKVEGKIRTWKWKVFRK